MEPQQQQQQQQQTNYDLPTILVVGATGNVGGEVIRQLQAAGDSKVIAAVRSKDKAKIFHNIGY